jgi:glycosyltransferase involved in cell wall biosynthesis
MQLHKIKLLHLLKTLDIGGIEKSTIIYSNELIESIGFIGIFSGKGIYNHDNLINKKISLYHNIKGKIGLNKYFLTNLFYLIKVIREERINIIFYHFRIYLPFILIIKVLFPQLKIVYVAHSYYDDFINYFLYANKYIAISEWVQKDLLKYGKSNITAIRHGINTKNNLTHQISEIKNIGFIGRFEKNKGIEILLSAFKELTKEYSNVNLIFKGEGKLRETIISFSSKFNLDNKIFVEEPIVDEKDLYRGIDILVFPSTSKEGFGLVISEAMSFGVPIVASDFIQENGLIEDHVTGIYFKNGDYLELATKLKLLIENRGLREKIYLNAREMIKIKFNLGNTISTYFEFLQKI